MDGLTARPSVEAVPHHCPYLSGYDPLSPSENRNPYPSFARARRETPVFYDPRLDLWSIVRRSDVIDALLDPQTFSSAGAVLDDTPPPEVQRRMPTYPWTGAVLSIDEPEHKRARAILRAPFTPRRAELYAPEVRERAARLLEPLARTGRIEFLNDVAFPLSLAVAGGILGVPEERLELLDRGVEAAHKISGLAAGGHAEKVKLAETLADLVDYMRELITSRRAEPTDDYTSVMVHTPGPDGRLDDTEQMIKHVWAIIAAGFETTANQLALGLRSLLENPSQWALLIQDRTLVPGAVEEMLRYRGLLKRLFRTTTRDVDVAGVTIPKGARVALLTAATNRDPEGYATDPDAFDVTRQGPHLSFGRGVHLCVGAHLARVEMRTVLDLLLERFPDVRLDETEREPGPVQLRFDTLHRLWLNAPIVAPTLTGA